MKKTLTLVLTVVLVLSFISSCKKNDQEQYGPSEGDTAPGFTETDAGGNSFSLNSVRGKVILFTISTMWCGPCRAEAPELVTIYNTYKDSGLEIVQIIHQDEDGNPTDLEDINRWVTEYNIPFTVLMDPDYSTVDTYNPGGYPYNVVIDRNFVIRYIGLGFDQAAIIQQIETYL
jgi:peroxiredoxin